MIRYLPLEEMGLLGEGVLFRIVRGDTKGRPFGSPRNPRVPTLEEFNPRVGEVAAGELAVLITGRRHGINREQAERIEQMTTGELLQFREDDPMSGTAENGGFSITGGHHRMNEIIQRVRAGKLPQDTPVRILFHD
jgi:hypothetical protein